VAEVRRYENATRLEEVVDRLAELGPRARLVAGATDLMRDEASAPGATPPHWIDLSRIPELDGIALRGGALHLGPLVTHSRIARSDLVVRHALPLAQACLEVGTPQVRNRGTLAGSLGSAHATSDPVPALVALAASVQLLSAAGERNVAVHELVVGDGIRPDEIIVDIVVPVLENDQRGLFAKHRPRRGAAVATVNLAAVAAFAADGTVIRASLVACGAPPIVVDDPPLIGRALDEASIAETARVVANAVPPVTDVRAGADYRRTLLEVLVRRSLRALRDGSERAQWPKRPVALWGANRDGRVPPLAGAATTHEAETPIIATVNGEARTAPLAEHSSLLAWLREAVGLTGCKDGCGEGVCGACTIVLDGLAVAACLVPAARAHGATITTIEGIGDGDRPGALQQAFVDENAIQCGFCTPGFVVACASLLGDTPRPRGSEVESALAGNLCRCTGYRAIARAVQRAADEDGDRPA
jgi:carbon-monoxide dehydrogenase medium subunit